MFQLDQYRAARAHGAIVNRSDRALIGLEGPDRVSFLHSLLSNDIEHLAPGTGCYATYLTQQGRMIADMRVLNAGHDILLDVPRATQSTLLARFDRSLFSEDVRLANRSNVWTSFGVHGPGAASLLSGALAAGAKTAHDSAPAEPMAAWREYQNREYVLNGTRMIVIRDDELGVPGYDLWLDAAHASSFRASLLTSGAPEMNDETIETLRVEAGRPRWGVDMNEDTIPLEAGIEHRAISFDKGCYVGQEVIVRILHRGHGRVARRLVGLTASADSNLARGDVIQSDSRDVGHVTSAALSPDIGRIALGYVQRDFVAPGTRVSIVHGSHTSPAVVAELPFVKP